MKAKLFTPIRLPDPANKYQRANWLIVAMLTIVIIVSIISLPLAQANDKQHQDKDINRKSIVFDIKTPKVFYCPQEKQSDLNKMIVKAKPLDSLCEFGGKTKPKSLPSDCYNDVDETEFACDEKKRFMMRLDLSSEINQSDSINGLDYIMAKSSNKKKATPSGKKY